MVRKILLEWSRSCSSLDGLPNDLGGSTMIRKLLYSIPLTGLLVLGSQIAAQPRSEVGKQSSPSTKSVAGKVTAIGKTGTSFAVQVDGSNNQTMEFLVKTKTQVQGEVKVGSLVDVDYQRIEGGQNLAVNVTVRS